MTYKAAFRKVMLEYEHARDSADIMREERKTQAYLRVPEIAEIDKEISRLGASLSRFALAGDDIAMCEAREKIQKLTDSRESLLTSTFGENYLKAVYRCDICMDMGHVFHAIGRPATRCVCLKQRLVDEYYSLSNMKAALGEENFDTYDLRLFSQEIIPAEGLSPYANMQHIHDMALKFVTNFDTQFDNLLLCGEPGLGKTFVCHCIAKDLLDAGRTVLYLTAPRLCKILEDYRFNRDAMAEPDEMLAAIDDVDLLILDDLGAEISTVVTSASLFDIVNQRLLTRKHTVISTNLMPDSLEMQYSERIVSRFFGNYQIVKFFGEDIRVKKKYGAIRR